MSKGSVVGGILLVAGSCIGAGMLGLPIQTGLSGFFPAIGMMLLSWLFMTTTALLLVEVNGWFSHKVNLLTMSEKTLGKIGKAICWVTYLFLFYALLVAYISGTGNLFSSIFHNSFSYSLPIWVGSLSFVILFGWIVYWGTRRVDLFNRFLMVGKIGFFLLFIIVGAQYVQPTLLIRSDPQYAVSALPLLVIGFGFHNMIPSLTSYLGGDLRRVRLTIIGGSLFCLIVYLIWEIVVLGIVPLEGANGIVSSLEHGQEAAQSVAALLGSPWIRTFAQGLAFFALLTSFLAQTLALVHYLSDGFKINYKKRENLWICTLVLLPPLILSLIYPDLFFKALNFAGGICAVILFGLLPVAMVWIGRYRRDLSIAYTVPGGKTALSLIFLFALFILYIQLSAMIR